MRKPLKPLTADQFKRKVELALRTINQAVEHAYTATSDLQLLAEDQMDSADRVIRPKESAKLYNVASDVNDWATEICDKLDEIDSASVRVALSKSVK